MRPWPPAQSGACDPAERQLPRARSSTQLCDRASCPAPDTPHPFRPHQSSSGFRSDRVWRRLLTSLTLNGKSWLPLGSFRGGLPPGNDPNSRVTWHRAASKQSSFVFDRLAAFHHKLNTPKFGDVIHRITRDGDQVSKLSGLDCADAILPAEQQSGVGCRRSDRLRWSHPVSHHPLDLFGVAAMISGNGVRTHHNPNSGLQCFRKIAWRLMAQIIQRPPPRFIKTELLFMGQVMIWQIEGRDHRDMTRNHHLDRFVVEIRSVLNGSHSGAHGGFDAFGGMRMGGDTPAGFRGILAAGAN